MNGYAVEFSNVSLVRNNVKILNNVSLNIRTGESVAVIGPNGSGKTSLMRLLKGDVRPYSDPDTVCRLFGEERWNIFDLRKNIGVVSTELQSRFRDAAVRDVIISGFFRTAGVYRDHLITQDMTDAAEDAASRAGVHDKLSRNVEKLSLGEMRRVLIARALAPRPQMLLFDEPMTGLDIVMKEQFRNVFDSLIKDGTSVVIITHDLEDIPSGAKRIIMMKNGEIYADGKKEELLNSSTVSGLFSHLMEVTADKGTYRMRSL